MWWFVMVACHLNPQEHIRLWHDDAGQLVGYAILGEYPTFDCQVLPDDAWAGIEAEALAWAETRLAALRDPQRWSSRLVSGARGMERACVSTGVSNTLALGLYESIGFKSANT